MSSRAACSRACATRPARAASGTAVAYGLAVMNQASDAHNEAMAGLIPELDQLAIDAMADWKVPGAALAVAQDGKVVLVKAYGQRDVEANLP